MAKNPKIIICGNCSNPIPKNVKKCPLCGAKNKKPFYKRAWFIVLVIIAAVGIIGSISGRGGNKAEKFNWSDMELSVILPEPKSNMGRIISNSDEDLNIYIHKTSKDEYNDYLDKCRDIGFTVESNKSSDRYSAFNGAGYNLSLWYDNSDGELNIVLKAPMEMGVIQWPAAEIANLLPLPKSTIGNISIESSNRFRVYVGETSKDDYNAYVNECVEKGFSVDYQKGDTYYYADNADGYHLALNYEGNKVMAVDIAKSKESGEEKTADPSEMTSTMQGNNSGGKDEILNSYIIFDYKDVLRNPDDFKGKYVILTVQIQQKVSSWGKTYYRAYTDESGSGWYFSDEWIINDKRVDDDTKIIDEDIIVVYGTLNGIEKVTRALGGIEDEIPVIDMLYMDILGEDETPPVAGSNSGLPDDRNATIGEANALKSAKSYLKYSNFSYTGLIKQLEFEGYTTEEATYAADNCGADWNEQAAKKAESYLDLMSFSKSGLIDQLEFEGFTHEQAEYGAAANGY